MTLETLITGPIDFPGARASFVHDPDGNVIELNQAVPGQAVPES